MRSRAWIFYLAAGIVTTALYRVGFLARNPYLYEAIGLSAAIAIVVGVIVHRPKHPLPWLLFAAAQVLFVTGDYCYYTLNLDFPAFADGFYLAFYPLQVAGLLLLIRRRSPGRDWASLVDASIISIGAGVLVWVFLIEPYAQQPGLGEAARLISIAYPLMDILLLAVAVRLVIGPGTRSKAFWFLVAGILCLVVTDSIYGYIQLNGVYREGDLLDVGWIATYLLWGAAALHPSMRKLFATAPAVDTRLRGGRLALLAAATLMAPIVLIVRSPSTVSGLHLPIVEIASAILFLLVLARMSGLLISLRAAVARHQRAEHRETVLRMAAARLTTAPGRDDIRQSIEAAALDLATDVAGFDVEAEIYAEPKHSHTFEPAGPSDALEPSRRLFTLPLATQSSVYGVIVARAAEELPSDVVELLETLGSQMTLALESASLTEHLNRRLSEDRVAALIRNSSDVVMVVDADLTIRYVTPSVTRVLGYQEDEFMGHGVSEFLHPDEIPLVAPFLTELASRREGIRTEWRVRHRDGHWMDVESVSNDLLCDPAVEGIVVTARDISQRKEMEQGLKSQVRKLQELDRIKNDFVGTVSHELRTPLANIIGEAEMLGDGDFCQLTGKQSHMVEVIDRNSHRLLTLVEDLLTLNHIESGTLELQLAETPVAGLLESVEREISLVAARRHITIDTQVDDDLGSAVVDANQLERAIMNLLTNAVKFSPEGGRVTVTAQRKPDEVVFTVADTGVGIPEDEQDRLFTRFFRSSISTKMAVQGSGLGLVIVKRIVEEHLGTISLTSKPGEGTTVRFTIPTAAVPVAIPA